MPDPGIRRDNNNRNRTRQASGGLSGFNPNVGTQPKISTTTPANKIQSSQFTAGHTMDPGQRGGTSRTTGRRGTTLDPGQRGGLPTQRSVQQRSDLLNRNPGYQQPQDLLNRNPGVFPKAPLSTKSTKRYPYDAGLVNQSLANSGTVSDPSKRGTSIGTRSASAGMAGFNPNVGSAMPTPAAPIQKTVVPKGRASSGMTVNNPNVGAPTVQASAPSMWGQNQQMPAFESPEWDSMQAMVEREFGAGQDIYNPTYDEQRFPTIVPPVVDPADIKFMPGIDGAPSSYDLTAPNNEGLLGYQAPAATPTDPLGVDFDMGILEEALAVQEPPVMPPMGGIPDMGGDYGGAPVGGNTGNLGTFDPFASDEYLRFGSELAGLENQEGMVDESRGFWDISQDRKWDEVMRQIPGLFNQRGMADSGLLNRANALSLGDREFETSLRDWMDENQKSAINRGQMAAEQGLMQSQLQNMFDMFGSGAITPMNQPTMNQMDPMGVFNQTADAIAQGPSNYYGGNPTMDQLNAFNAATTGWGADQKDNLSRLFASNAGMI